MSCLTALNDELYYKCRYVSIKKEEKTFKNFQSVRKKNSVFLKCYFNVLSYIIFIRKKIII